MRLFAISAVLLLGACAHQPVVAPGLSVTVSTAVAATPSKVIAYAKRFCGYRASNATAVALITAFGGPYAVTADAVAAEVCAAVAARYASTRPVMLRGVAL